MSRLAANGEAPRLEERTMSEQTHTPGPWTATPCPCAHQGCSSWMVEPVAVQQGIISDEADARLIAAAPELLDALTRLLDYQTTPVMNRREHQYRAAVHKARAALEKAEGRHLDVAAA